MGLFKRLDNELTGGLFLNHNSVVDQADIEAYSNTPLFAIDGLTHGDVFDASVTAAEYLGYAELGLAVGSLKAFIRNLDADNAKYAADNSGPHENVGGAGGNWQVIDEVEDPSVVKQLNEMSCGQACVSMMLGDRKINATQGVINKLAGNGPTYEAQLASVLNKVDSSSTRQWIGAGVDAEDIGTFQGLSSTGSWAAQLWEKGNKIGHWVVVDGLDDTG
jgi:hypothetical protein